MPMYPPSINVTCDVPLARPLSSMGSTPKITNNGDDSKIAHSPHASLLLSYSSLNFFPTYVPPASTLQSTTQPNDDLKTDDPDMPHLLPPSSTSPSLTSISPPPPLSP